MNVIIDAAFSRAGAVLVALIMLFIIGLHSYITIPKEAKPDTDIPVAYVSVPYEGISPEDAERLLVKPLEKKLRSVEGLDKMTSVSTEGYGSVRWNLQPVRTLTRRLMMRSAVDEAKPDLPPD